MWFMLYSCIAKLKNGYKRRTGKYVEEILPTELPEGTDIPYENPRISAWERNPGNSKQKTGVLIA
jgi:hypothetical protein